MKKSLLAFLQEGGNGYVSGQEISKRLGISRTAVWKQIQALRSEGYEIESSSRLGYRLAAVPDRLYPELVSAGLKTGILGRKIIYHESIDSTNAEAKRLAAEGAPEGTVIVAEMQSGGRGRLGREWASPGGGIWFSLVLRPQMTLHQASLFTLAAGVAAREATWITGGIEPGIKWPNDLLAGDKKLAGILTEVSAETDRVNYLVLGVGLNANIEAEKFPPGLRDTATSVLLETGRPLDRPSWLRTFLERMDTYYINAKKAGFGDVLAAWRKYSLTLGKNVCIRTAGGLVRGEALDIDDYGALLVRTTEGVQAVYSGEVLPHISGGG